MPAAKLNAPFALLCLLLLAACTDARSLMPTPALYAVQGKPLFGRELADLADTEVELFYFTDRAPEQDEQGRLCLLYTSPSPRD